MKAFQDREEKDLKNAQEEMSRLSHEVDTLIPYADRYDSASIEAKKMILSCLIRRVDVCRGCRLKVEFNFSLEQYLPGIDREDFLKIKACLTPGGTAGSRPRTWLAPTFFQYNKAEGLSSCENRP